MEKTMENKWSTSLILSIAYLVIFIAVHAAAQYDAAVLGMQAATFIGALGGVVLPANALSGGIHHFIAGVFAAAVTLVLFPLPYAITRSMKKNYTPGTRDFVAIDAFWRMILAINLFVLFVSVVGVGVYWFQG